MGNIELDPTPYLLLKIYFSSFPHTALAHVWWIVCGRMAWSGLLVLVVNCVDKFSLLEGGLLILFFVFVHYIWQVLVYIGSMKTVKVI